MIFNRFFWTALLLPIVFAPVSSTAQDNRASISLQFPVKCTLDEDCFLQQFVDMDESEKHIDPFCGGATYDGHKGTDIRVRSLQDIDNNITVLAAASGTIKGIRTNKPDKLVVSENDRKAVEGIECGNGVVLDHGNGIETQYCHLKQGSATLSVGDTVETGETLGFVGASGMAQFPHLHITVRKDGRVIDPFTGNTQSQGCDRASDKAWWMDKSILTAKRDTVLLGNGLTGAPIKHNTLVVGPPPPAKPGNSATVGWVWYSNLKKNDRVYMKLQGPNGFETENTTDPLNRNKASWSGYVGKKRQPQIGAYKLTSYILRRGETGTVENLSRNETVIAVEE